MIRDSTISGNSAQDDGGGIESFGSMRWRIDYLWQLSGRLRRRHLLRRRDDDPGLDDRGQLGRLRRWGILALGGNPSVVNTILANDSAGGIGPDLASPNGIFQVAFSLIANPAGAPINTTVAGSNITGADPQLGALGDNGGPAKTQALPPLSPAVDAGRATLPAITRDAAPGRPARSRLL